VGGSRRAYWRLLLTAARRDRAYAHAAGRAARETERRLAAHGGETHALVDGDAAALLTLLDHAREAMVRSDPERSLHDVDEWAAQVKGRIETGDLTATDVQSLHHWGREFFVLQRGMHRFPGACVEKAFNLAIKGLHYEIVMRGIAAAGAGGRGSPAVGATAAAVGNGRLTTTTHASTGAMAPSEIRTGVS
jgi:hypothetical protein